jgi:hypothetical protein
LARPERDGNNQEDTVNHRNFHHEKIPLWGDMMIRGAAMALLYHHQDPQCLIDLLLDELSLPLKRGVYN